MAKIAFQDLAHYILPHAPDVPLPLIEQVLNASAREFCRSSTAYRGKCDPLTLVEGLSTYELSCPQGLRATEILSGTYNGQQLAPLSAVLEDQTPHAPVRGYYQTDQNVVIVGTPERTEVNAVEFLVSFSPKLLTYEIDEKILEEYQETIVNGALYNLLSMPGKSWSSPAANDYAQKFYAGIEEAKQRADNDNTAKLRVVSYNGL